MSATADDYRWMARALELAERGLYTTTPNPRVGAVVVKDGAVVGEGWHRRAGEAHAQVLALAQASHAEAQARTRAQSDQCQRQRKGLVALTALPEPVVQAQLQPGWATQVMPALTV